MVEPSCQRSSLEIEADSAADVLRIAGQLGYPERRLSTENTIKIYQRHGIDLNAVAELRL